MSATPKTLVVTLDGTAQKISETRIRAISVLVYSETGNSAVRVGDANVSLTGGLERGIPVAAGAGVDISTPMKDGDDADILLNELYVIGTSTQKVQVLYLE